MRRLGKKVGKHESGSRRAGEVLDKARGTADDASEESGGLIDAASSAEKRRGARRPGRGRPRLWMALVLSFLLGAAVGWMGWKWGWLDAALREAERAVSTIWKEERADGVRDRRFMEHPLTGQEIEGGSINTAVAVLSDDNTVLFLAYLRWTEGEALRVMLLPTSIVGLSTKGEDLTIASALKAGGGNPTELRYLLEGLAGGAPHYLFLLPVMRLPALGEALELPVARVKADCEAMNPFTASRESLREGMLLRDRDRIISYVMAWGARDPYAESVDRISAYLQDLLLELRDKGIQALNEALLEASGAWEIAPAPPDSEKAAGYAASLLSAWAERDDVVFSGVPRIEILNGCGVVGAGTAFQRRLESRGFRVAEATRNAKVPGEDVNDFSYQSSVVFIGDGDALNEAYAQYIARLFRIPRVEYREGVADVVIVVGSDLASPVIE